MSNFINPNFKKNHKSATSSIFEKTKDISLVNFGFGQSPFPPPKFLVDNLSSNCNKNKYLPNQGILELRTEISEHYSKKNNITITPDQVVIGNGSKQLIFLLFMIINCEIFIPKPCWVSYMDQLKILKKKYKSLNTNFHDQYKVTPEILEKTMYKEEVEKNRLLVFNNPHNPTGIVYTSREIIDLSKTLKKDNTIILADEIYSELVFSNQYSSFMEHLPLQTIVVSSVSKFLGCGGWRLGFMIIPKPLMDFVPIINSIISQSFTNVSSPIQYASLGMFTNPETDLYLDKCRHILEALSNYCCKHLKKKIRFIKPEASWYLYLDFALLLDQLNKIGIHNCLDLERKLFELGLVVLACDHFGVVKGDLSVRCCLVDFDGKDALDNFNPNIDSNWVETYCPKIVKGIGIINTFVNSLT